MRFIRSCRLVDWCLRVIVENLDLFIYSKCVPQKHIDFLLRLYSEDVFYEYNSLNAVTEECMLWFLNPHNRKITLSILSEKVIKQLQVVGTTITSLNLKESLATENMLNSIICCVPHLKYLDLSSTTCSNKTLLFLQKMCLELTTLNIRECEEVTNTGMINLCDSNLKLTHLDIIDTEVEYDGIYYILQGMPSLQCLKFYNLADSLCFAHEYDYITGNYKYIQYNLTELIYECTDMCDDPLNVILMWTFMCPKIKKIHFHFPVSEEVLHMCTRFQYLEEMKIKMSFDNNYVRINNVFMPILPVSNSLNSLILSLVEVPTVLLIENFINLKHLYLSNVHFTDFLEEDIKTTETKLETLIIKDTNFEFPTTTYKAITLLISLSKNVTMLRLNCVSAVPQNIFHIILNSMKYLTFIDLSYCNVEMSSAIHFFEIPSMKLIYLDLCNSCHSFDKDSPFKSILVQNSPCTLSWRMMTDNLDDSDSDILSDKDG